MIAYFVNSVIKAYITYSQTWHTLVQTLLSADGDIVLLKIQNVYLSLSFLDGGAALVKPGGSD